MPQPPPAGSPPPARPQLPQLPRRWPRLRPVPTFSLPPVSLQRPLRVAHVSDLHVGQDSAHDGAAASLAQHLAAIAPDYIALTGDVTNTGRASEGKLFMRLFHDLLPRMVVVPGNHDRGFDNFGAYITAERSWMVDRPGVRFICLDSTLPGNEFMPIAWGDLYEDQIVFAAAAARATPLGALPVVLLHHHVFPAEADGLLEALFDHQGFTLTRAMDNGRKLLAAMGRRGLILHGHKHRPTYVDQGWHPPVYNAGSTTELGQYRLFEIAGGAVTRVESHTVR